jgi:hypothetical protein
MALWNGPSTVENADSRHTDHSIPGHRQLIMILQKVIVQVLSLNGLQFVSHNGLCDGHAEGHSRTETARIK